MLIKNNTVSTYVAPMITGQDIKKAILIEAFLSNFSNKAMLIIMPDLETPGINASA